MSNAARQLELGEQPKPRGYLQPPRLAPIPQGQRAKPGLLEQYKALLAKMDREAAQGGNHNANVHR